MAADTFDARPINVLRSRLAGLSSAWALFLARISQEIVFNPQASAQVQRCHSGFLFRFLQCGRRPLVGPLRKAAWSSESLWPNRSGDHSTRKRTWRPGHSAISRAASILALFKLTHYPR